MPKFYDNVNIVRFDVVFICIASSCASVSGRPDQTEDLLFSSFQESLQMVDKASRHTKKR